MHSLGHWVLVYARLHYLCYLLLSLEYKKNSHWSNVGSRPKDMGFSWVFLCEALEGSGSSSRAAGAPADLEMVDSSKSDSE